MLRSAGIGLLLTLSAACVAEEPKLPQLAPLVRSVLPAGGQVGESFEVLLRGTNLQDALDVSFARGDVYAEICSSDYYELRLIVHAGANVPPGLHSFEVVTAKGAFSGQLHLGNTRSTREVEPNNEVEKAQKLKLPATVDGVVENADYDHYSFEAKAGTTVVIDVVGNRSGSFLDSKIAVFNSAGQEIAFNEDWHLGGDPHLTFTPPANGDYIVQISHAAEFGNRDFSYRMTIGVNPFLDRVTPGGLQRGSTTQVELTGVNLDAVTGLSLDAGEMAAEIISQNSDRLVANIRLPNGIPAGRSTLRVRTQAGYADSTVGMIISDTEEKTISTSATRDKPQPLADALAYTAVLEKKGARHFYVLETRAGDTLTFAVQSMQLGYPLDPTVTLYDSAGQIVAFQDERARSSQRQVTNLDPELTQVFEKPGRFLLMVRDSGSNGSQRHLYRLSVRQATPTFQIETPTPSVTLYRGKKNIVQVRVRRFDGWNSPVEVWAEGGPAGMHSPAVTAEAKDSEYKDCNAKSERVDGTDVELPVTVAADAKADTYPLTIRARGRQGSVIVERTLASVYPSGFVHQLYGPMAKSQILAAVTELPPVIVNVPPAVTLTGGKTDKLKLEITRFDGGGESLKIEPDVLPPGVSLENNTLEPGKGAVELRFKTAKDVKPGKHIVRLRAGTVETQHLEFNVLPAPPDEKKADNKEDKK